VCEKLGAALIDLEPSPGGTNRPPSSIGPHEAHHVTLLTLVQLALKSDGTRFNVEPAIDASPPRIKPRSPQFAFDATIPRHWLNESTLATHVVNGVNLLFPAGERCFVRSVLRFDKTSPEVRAFCAQEGRHANAHERFFEILRAQGFEIDGFLKWYQRVVFDVIEKVAPAALRLSATAAAEHFTATLANASFRKDIFGKMHPTMQRFLAWHAAEEIEHKAVAFDVLRRTNPSYALRMAGLALATAVLGGFWTTATVMLLLQDPAVTRARVRAEAHSMRRHDPLYGVFVRGIRAYIRRDFHPLERDDYALAAKYLAEAGIA
jgi:predicted metal-dependent hydrolase